MAEVPESPFESVESAQQFIELLCDAVEEARAEVDSELSRSGSEAPEDRRLQALQLVSYNLAKLSLHMTTSRRILNDLRTLRRLLFQERGSPEPEEDRAEAAGSGGEIE